MGGDRGFWGFLSLFRIRVSDFLVMHDNRSIFFRGRPLRIAIAMMSFSESLSIYQLGVHFFVLFSSLVHAIVQEIVHSLTNNFMAHNGTKGPDACSIQSVPILTHLFFAYRSRVHND